MYREIYLKELAQVIVETDESKICGADPQAGTQESCSSCPEAACWPIPSPHKGGQSLFS